MEYYYDKSLDSKFVKIDELKWTPWIGKDYLYGASSPKILVIGESHYEWEKEEDDQEPIEYLKDPNFTRDFINQRGLHFLTGGIENANVLRNLERAIFKRKNVGDENKLKLWRNSSYYVFIQRALSSRENNDRPNAQDFIKGWEAFDNVVSILKPDICLFLGVESSNHYNGLKSKQSLNSTFLEIEKYHSKIGSSYPRIGSLKLANNKNIKLVFIKHPSSYFSWEEWGSFLDDHIKI